MLSPLQKLAFQLHRKGFSYMSPLPVEWDTKFEKAAYHNSKKQWICFLTLIVFEALLAFACTYDVIGHYVFKPREHFNLGIGGMHTAAGIAWHEDSKGLLLLPKLDKFAG